MEKIKVDCSEFVAIDFETANKNLESVYALGTLNTFRTKYYYQIIELSPQIEALNVEFRTALFAS